MFHKLYLIKLLLFFVITAVFNAYSQSYKELDSFIKEKIYPIVYEDLPQEFLAKNAFKVKIKFKKLNNLNLLQNENICKINFSKNKFVFAYYIKSLNQEFIVIDSSLARIAYNENSGIKKALNDSFCIYSSFTEKLQSTLVHELFHFMDHKLKISKSKKIKKILGGEKVFYKNGAKLRNRNYSWSADPYEFKNIKENLAVNFELLIKDPLFACKRPAYFKIYTKYFPSLLLNKKYSNINCDSYQNVLISSNTHTEHLFKTINLRSLKLYEIHYLHAGKSKAIMSRMGHAMFRLVYCAPHRKEASQECLKDVNYHLVLSYRANVSDYSINYLLGVLGKYPSEVFIYQLADIIQEYTLLELRDLTSLPLNYTNEEKEFFIDLTLERFWTYRGQYYFFNNNCGTETLRHFNASLSDKKYKDYRLKAFTPQKIYKKLSKEIFEIQKVSSHDAKTYFEDSLLIFPSFHDQLYSSLKTLKNTYNLNLFYFVDLKKKSCVSQEKRHSGYDFILNKFSDSKDVLTIINNVLNIESFCQSIAKLNFGETLLKELKNNLLFRDKLEEFAKINQSSLFYTQWTHLAKFSDYGILSKEKIHKNIKLEKENRKKNDVDNKIIEIFKSNKALSLEFENMENASKIDRKLKKLYLEKYLQWAN